MAGNVYKLLKNITLASDARWQGGHLHPVDLLPGGVGGGEIDFLCRGTLPRARFHRGETVARIGWRGI